MKGKIRFVCGVICIVVSALFLLFFLITMSEGGWMFLLLSVPFLAAGFGLVWKKSSTTPLKDTSGRDKKEDVVFVTEKGGRFHETEYCRSLKNSKVIKMTRKKAIAAGYKPCETCREELYRYFDM